MSCTAHEDREWSNGQPYTMAVILPEHDPGEEVWLSNHGRIPGVLDRPAIPARICKRCDVVYVEKKP